MYGHTGAEAMAKAGSCGVSEAEARPDAAFATDPHNPVFFLPLFVHDFAICGDVWRKQFT
ncbi:MAG: hypothetical protein AB7D00_11475 [Rhodospirillaceae bacterium]